MGKDKEMHVGAAERKTAAPRGGRGRLSAAVIIIFMAAALLTECHSGPPKISIENAKAVMSAGIYGEAMVTMTIKNVGGADTLTGVSTNIPGATATFHIMEGQRMAPERTVDIPGKKSMIFKTGGSHVMLENMPKSMAAGTPFTLTLDLAKSGQKQLHLTLEKAPAMPMNM
ncbi:MAG: copper chaperone PCu(A)C [Actinomycetota bacterium]|nr:copper chaperone PCu(A)C [Actinomycetota bacterium]